MAWAQFNFAKFGYPNTYREEVVCASSFRISEMHSRHQTPYGMLNSFKKETTVLCYGVFPERFLSDLDDHPYKFNHLDAATANGTNYFYKRGFRKFVFLDSGWFNFLLGSMMHRGKTGNFQDMEIYTLVTEPFEEPSDARPHPNEYSSYKVMENQTQDSLLKEVFERVGALWFYQDGPNKAILDLRVAAVKAGKKTLDYKEIFDTYGATFELY